VPRDDLEIYDWHGIGGNFDKNFVREARHKTAKLNASFPVVINILVLRSPEKSQSAEQPRGAVSQ
jgi:hypothetical protein